MASRTGSSRSTAPGSTARSSFRRSSDPTTIVGAGLPEGVGRFGLKAGTPVVAGAGDRACEVLGVAATTARPMVSGDRSPAGPRRSGTCPRPSRDLRFPRSARRLRDGGRPSLGRLGARVAGTAHRSQSRRARAASRRHRRGRRRAAGARVAGGCPGSMVGAATGLTFAGLTPAHRPRTWRGRWSRGSRSMRSGASTVPRPMRWSCRWPEAARRCRCGAGCSPAWRTDRWSRARTAKPPPREPDRRRSRDRRAARLRPARPVSSRERPFDSDVVAYADLRMRHEMVARATVSAFDRPLAPVAQVTG